MIDLQRNLNISVIWLVFKARSVGVGLSLNSETTGIYHGRYWEVAKKFWIIAENLWWNVILKKNGNWKLGLKLPGKDLWCL